MDKDIMNLTPESLAIEQYNWLKNYAIRVLTDAVKMIENEQFDELDEMLVTSPAGDECGTDSKHLDFNYEPYAFDEGDLHDVLERLKNLKLIAEMSESKC